MVLLFSPTTFLEITAFVLASVALVLAVRFFVDSRKRIDALFPGLIGTRKLLPFGIDRNGFVIPKNTHSAFENQKVSSRPPLPTSNRTTEEINTLRLQLQQQQKELEKALEKISFANQQNHAVTERSSTALDEQKRLEQLRMQLEKKDSEIQRLRQQELFSQKLQERFDDVQAECEKLQEKVLRLEKQAWQAAELSIQLEHAEQAQLQTEKALLKREERLRELTLENQQLHDAFQEVEAKLSQANLQRQQLLKKVQFLEEVNTDLQQVAEANRKLKTEMTRVAELESMLEMMKNHNIPRSS
jgi:chromosome segregation ATPase